MHEARAAKERATAAVIPIRAPEAEDAAALERAVAAPTGRGRAVLLTFRSGGDPAALLRRAGGQSPESVRCVVIETDLFGADELAARILAGQCSATPEAPRAVLRAWAAHLASEGFELAVVLEDAGRLPLDSASWLGRLVRASGGAVRLIIPWTKDLRIWRVIEELGLETEVVGASWPRVDRTAPAGPARTSSGGAEPTHFEKPTRRIGFSLRTLLAVGLTCMLALAAVVASWRLPADPPGAAAGGEAPAPALEARAAASAVAPPPAALTSEPGSARYSYDVQTDRVSFDLRGESLARVLSELSAQLGFEVRNLASDSLSRPVNLRVHQVLLDEALRELLRDFSKSFVYAPDPSAAGAPRLRVLIVLSAPTLGLQPRSAEVALPEGPPGSTSVALEVERAIDILLADDPGDLHAAAIDRLLALEPAVVARELVYQFDHLAPVGPLAPMRVNEAWERLRVALCANRPSGGAREPLPPELGCPPRASYP